MADLYESDFFCWTMEQASLIRNKRCELEALGIDWVNVAEELDTLGRSEKRELRSRFAILLLHLLKWQYQPTHQGASWKLTIEEHREAIAEMLANSLSLTHLLDQSMKAGYKAARRRASVETGLAQRAFPDDSPWTMEQVLGPDFLP